MTLRRLGELMKGLGKPSYSYFDFEGNRGNTPFESSHWILMTRTVPDETRNKSYRDHLMFIARHPNYSVPKMAEAIVAIFMEHLATGVYLYSTFQNPKGERMAGTHCQEIYTNRYNEVHQVLVYDFEPTGMRVQSMSNILGWHLGIAPLRRL